MGFGLSSFPQIWLLHGSSQNVCICS